MEENMTTIKQLTKWCCPVSLANEVVSHVQENGFVTYSVQWHIWIGHDDGVSDSEIHVVGSDLEEVIAEANKRATEAMWERFDGSTTQNTKQSLGQDIGSQPDGKEGNTEDVR